MKNTKAREHSSTPALSGLLLAVLAMALLIAPAAQAADRGAAVAKSRVGESQIGQSPALWTTQGRASAGSDILNPAGGLNGDLRPTVIESSLSPHAPWVIWSRFNGVDYDLAWSKWSSSGWKPILWVDTKQRPGNDLDADMMFDRFGRPFVVWWTEENGEGAVYVSLYLTNRWMAPFRVSLPDIDSRYPVLRRVGPRQIEVEYQTLDGSFRQIVNMFRPNTITDDINPTLLIHHAPVQIQAQP